MPRSILTLIIAVFFIITSFSYKTIRYRKMCYIFWDLKNSGLNIKDSIPFHTIYHYFKSGKLHSTEIADDSGHLNGTAKVYYENGEIYQISNYMNDLHEGFVYNYYRGGKMKSKFFVLNDMKRGDCYYWHKDGSNREYDFIDFHNYNRVLIQWDTTGKVINDKRPIMFLDTVISYNEANNKDHEFSYNTMVLVSNPPKCRTVVRINYLSRNGIIMKSDSTVSIPYYFSKDHFMDSLSTIKFFGVQYDSLTKKTLYQRDEAEME